MKAQNLSSDRITTLPQTIIETILCLLPIEEAVGTSIFSREWRYKWTTIPKLVFDWNFVHERSNMSLIRELLNAIRQVLLLRQDPIHEFSLSMGVNSTYFEIEQIILHLSRNHPVKKLTLHLGDCYLPLCLFSLHHLTDLCLERCSIKHGPVFNGFSSLTSLSMSDVYISRESFLHLLSNCPSLKRLWLVCSWLFIEAPTLVELFKCIPLIEHLTISSDYVECGVDTSVSLELPMPLLNLKYFDFKGMRFNDSELWAFLSVLIKCSPNLEKFKLETDINWEWVNTLESPQSSLLKECSAKLKEYSDLQLMHLNELEVEDFTNFEPTMEFVKFMLFRSPNLKKVILRTQVKDKNEELEMFNMLLCTPKASSVEIIVENRCKSQQ